MIVTQTKEIGGRSYRLEPFGFDDWLKLSAEITDIIGPVAGMAALAKMQATIDVGGALQSASIAILQRANSGILDRLLAQLSVNLVVETPHDNWIKLSNPKHRDIWIGTYIDGVLAIKWVLEVAFGDFIRDATKEFRPLLLKHGLVEMTPEEKAAKKAREESARSKQQAPTSPSVSTGGGGSSGRSR